MNEKQPSSGVRLMTLLTERLPEIIGRERGNERFVHLYCTGNYWVAIERSAYLLHRLCPQSRTSTISLSNYPFPIVLVSITDREMQNYSPNNISHTDDPNYIVLGVSSFSAKSYQTWHNREVKDFPLYNTPS